MIITYSGTDDIYHLSAFEILNNSEIGNEKILTFTWQHKDRNVHFGGKILQTNDEILLCLGDINSPGNSAEI